MKTITGSATWSNTASVPLAGERPARATHIETPVQTVLNNTVYVNAAAEALGSRPPVTFIPLLFGQTELWDTGLWSRPTAIVDTVDHGTLMFANYDPDQSSVLRIPAVGSPWVLSTGPVVEVLPANAGLIVRAAITTSIAGGAGNLAALSNVSGTYYLVVFSNNRVYGSDYASRSTLGRATSIDGTPQMIWDPLGDFWMRVGQYVANGALTVNEDCGCGDPATSKPCLGAYNGTVVVGYYGGVSGQCAVRYKVGAGTWTAGGVIGHDSGTKYVKAVNYDPARAVWTAIISSGTVFETASLASAWTEVGSGFPSTLYGSSFAINDAWILGKRVLVWGKDTSNYALLVTGNSGVTWSVLSVQQQSSGSYEPQAFFGGRHWYWDSNKIDTIPGSHALLKSQMLLPPCAGDWP